MVTFANGLSEVQCNIVLYYTHFSEFNQTKRRHHRTYTVDEADALGLAIPLPQGAMGAVGRHGNCSERSPTLGGGDFRTAVRCDTWYYSTYRTVETERTSENPPLTGTYVRGLGKIFSTNKKWIQSGYIRTVNAGQTFVVRGAAHQTFCPSRGRTQK
jgi:hypothetical protein